MSDWWSFGILIYEMLYGKTPFFSMDKDRMYDLITTGGISYPTYLNLEDNEESLEYNVSEEAKDLINKLLEKDPGARLGREGLEEIKNHPFFYYVNFDEIQKKRIKALFKPDINSEDLTNNFDEEYFEMDINESPVENWFKNDEYSESFKKFENKKENDDFEILDPIELAIDKEKKK